MNDMLQVKGLGKNYQAFTLQDITFTLPTGYVMGFIGQNGAGKTTTMKLILQMVQKDSGEVLFMGSPISAVLKQQIGVVFDSSFLLDDWKVKDIEGIFSGFYQNWDHALYEQYLHRFSLDKTKKIKDLSRGMKTKMSLAVALSFGAKLLILDEPTSGLDPVARDEILEILQEYIQDGTRSILFSTHITSDLERIADYITFINKGRMVYTGLKDEFLESFYIVKGGRDVLTSAQRQKIIGMRMHSTGFDGLIHAQNKGEFNGMMLEKPSIQDIMVYISKGEEEE